MTSLGATLATRKKRADSPGIPAGFFCPNCLRVERTKRRQFTVWATKHRPWLVKDGEPISATGCLCPERERAEQQRRLDIVSDANLPARQDAIGQRTIDNFQRVKGSRGMVKAMASWVAGEDEPVLVFVGVTGCGKSHLLEAVVHEAVQVGVRARYERAEDYLVRLRAANAQEGDQGSLDDLLRWYRGLKVLALDDIGMVRMTSWGVGQLTALIDQRIADGSRLILAINYADAEEAAQVMSVSVPGPNGTTMVRADRLASRIYDEGSGSVKVVWCEADDYRRKKA